MKAKIITFIISSLLLSNCDFSKRNEKFHTDKDSFYSDLGGFGRPRIPLIKPYELIKVSENEWRLELQTPTLLTLSIHNIKGIHIQDSLIAVYSEGGTEFLNKQRAKAWFVINSVTGVEDAFVNEKSYTDVYFKSKDKQIIHFHSPDSIYKSFEEQGKIFW